VIFGETLSRFRPRASIVSRAMIGAAFVASLVLPIGVAAQSNTETVTPDLDSLKAQMITNVTDMKAGTAEVLAFAQWYYDQAKAVNFDYQALWDQRHDEIVSRLTDARAAWVDKAHANYELSEGLVAGVPSLSSFDVLIDAGPSGAEDPTNALDITLDLPDGSKLEKPGNYFHQVTEPALWGTNDAFVGLAVDMDGDGTIEVGEALPNANVLLAGVTALDSATGDLATAINDWQPSLSDAFTALVNMIPTMEGYFNEWKLSSFVMGAQSEERSFVASSRLVDVLGILSGLNLTYSKLQPLVESTDPAMATQIESGMTDMMSFVQGLLDKENAGTRFTPEEADIFGKSLQDQASTTAGMVTQAAALLDIPLENE
jgi:hypothetical protein